MATSAHESAPIMAVFFEHDKSSIRVEFDLDGKRRSLSRQMTEPTSQLLLRLARLALSKNDKRDMTKRAKALAKESGVSIQDATEQLMSKIPPASMFIHGKPANADLPVDDVLARATSAVFCGVRFRVVVDPPGATALELDTARPFVGCALHPAATLVHCAAGDCEWAWEAGRPTSHSGGAGVGKGKGAGAGTGKGKGKGKHGKGGAQGRAGGGDITWERVGSGPTFVPSATLLGARLRVTVTPRRPPAPARAPAAAAAGEEEEEEEEEDERREVRGRPVRKEYSGRVEPALESRLTAALEAFAAEHAGADDARGPDAAPTRLRVMTYNLLADAYANTPFARQVMFPYCPVAELDEDYRKQLLARQLAAPRADLVLAQEVAASLYDAFLLPAMRRAGYEGVLTRKAGSVQEGCALFFRPAAGLRLLARVDVALCDRRSADLDARLARPAEPAADCVATARAGDAAAVAAAAGCATDLATLWRGVPALAEAMAKVTTVGQVAVLAHGSGAGERRVCVANTHLFFHSNARHIRALQTATLVRAAAAVADAHRQPHGPRPALILGGDLNAQPGTLPHELLTTGRVEAGHADWACGETFCWGSSKVKVPPPSAGDGGGASGASGDAASAPEPAGDGAQPATAPGGDGEPAAAAPRDAEPDSKRRRTRAAAGRTVPDEQPLRCALATGVDMFSACGAPEVTTVVAGFEGALDWVFAEQAAFVAGPVLPAPSREALSEHGGLPCRGYPSDHIPQLADLLWRDPA